MKKTKIKKLINFILTAAVTFGLFAGVPNLNFIVNAETADIELSGGSFIARIEPIDDKTGWTAVSDRAGLEAMKTELDGKYYLTNDIDLSDAEWIPVGRSDYSAFKGVFDGQGHTIRNMKIVGNTDNFEYSGLFGYTEDAVIKNIGLEGININVAISYAVYAGGICGYGNNTEILNSYTSGSISASGSKSYIGGLIGFANGKIKNCFSLAHVSVIGNFNSNAGGLVGVCGSSLEISSCYAAGNITASSSDSSVCVGGLIGRSQSYDAVPIDAVITDCYRLSSQSITGGGTIDQSGLALDDNAMKQKSSFTGFDFDTVWGIDANGKSYPYLRAFVSNISISSTEARPGKEVSAKVKIENNPGIAAYKLTVSYDAGKLEYIGGTDTAAVGAGGLLGLQSINDDKLNGKVIVVAVNTVDITDDGLLFTLKFKVKAGILSDYYPLTLTYEENKDIKNQNNTPLNPQLISGGINVIKIVRGDANGDAIVDVGDLICLARHFAQIDVITDSICLEAADANKDEALNMADLIRLARHIAEIELLPTD